MTVIVAVPRRGWAPACKFERGVVLGRVVGDRERLGISAGLLLVAVTVRVCDAWSPGPG